MSLLQLKTWIGLKRAHIEPMAGSPESNLLYCSKQDSEPYVIGTLPTPGKRNDIHAAVEELQKGKSIRELATSDVTSAVSVVKFHRGLTFLRGILSPPRDPDTPPKIYWLHGPTGSGKTRSAFEFGASHVSRPEDIWISHSAELKWFCGYDGQSVVILDDFRSKGVKFNFLLRILDRYPMSVEIKGGSVNWNPTYILITTCHDIDGTFASRAQHRPEDLEQLKRRVTDVFEFPSDSDRFRRLFAVGDGSISPGMGTLDAGESSL